MYPVFDAIGLNIIRDQVAKNTFKQQLIAPLNRSVDELWQVMWKSQHIIYQQPHTVLHGDTHIANTYVLPGNEGGLLDWQLIVRGPWCHDIAYLMITGLDIETRRIHEKSLLNLYRETLLEKGVKNVPNEDEAYLLYRQSAIWGLVIGWLITPPQNYGEAITSANIHKMVTAMVDLDTLGSLQS
jgi:aminoglycoside phosphotransferase (APT) family kinase protein